MYNKYELVCIHVCVRACVRACVCVYKFSLFPAYEVADTGSI